ncbi:hypothetical protein J6590_003198 [Homalodisca vitripennis]|nr:hypothetical protein J6590_003198 [Homalodisca vitripennis]
MSVGSSFLKIGIAFEIFRSEGKTPVRNDRLTNTVKGPLRLLDFVFEWGLQGGPAHRLHLPKQLITRTDDNVTLLIATLNTVSGGTVAIVYTLVPYTSSVYSKQTTVQGRHTRDCLFTSHFAVSFKSNAIKKRFEPHLLHTFTHDTAAAVHCRCRVRYEIPSCPLAK